MLFPEFGRFGFGFDPFAEMRRMQNEMNRLFADFGMTRTQEFPPMNFWVGENSVVVTAEVPGATCDDLDIVVHEDVLTLKGKIQPEITDDKDVVWHRRERGYGDFVRTVQLPFRVDPDKVQARCRNGVLEIELHRPEAERPKKIQIQAA